MSCAQAKELDAVPDEEEGKIIFASFYLQYFSWNIQSILDFVLLIVANGSMALFQNYFQGGVL